MSMTDEASGDSSGTCQAMGEHIPLSWRVFPEIYKQKTCLRPGGCSWQCVPWRMFEDPVGQCLRSKVDETREADMSNMRAFPACGWQKALQRYKSGQAKIAIDTCTNEEAPCATRYQ